MVWGVSCWFSDNPHHLCYTGYLRNYCFLRSCVKLITHTKQCKCYIDMLQINHVFIITYILFVFHFK